MTAHDADKRASLIAEPKVQVMRYPGVMGCLSDGGLEYGRAGIAVTQLLLKLLEVPGPQETHWVVKVKPCGQVVKRVQANFIH